MSTSEENSLENAGIDEVGLRLSYPCICKKHQVLNRVYNSGNSQWPVGYNGESDKGGENERGRGDWRNTQRTKSVRVQVEYYYNVRFWDAHSYFGII